MAVLWRRYHPGKQELFAQEVEKLRSQVQALAKQAKRLAAAETRPDYRSGMIQGQDSLLVQSRRLTENTEKRFTQKIRETCQNLGADVSDDEDEKAEQTRRALAALEARQDEEASGELVEVVPEAESSPEGRAVIKWLVKNGVRAQKGTVADRLIASMRELKMPKEDWVEALGTVRKAVVHLH